MPHLPRLICVTCFEYFHEYNTLPVIKTQRNAENSARLVSQVSSVRAARLRTSTKITHANTTRRCNHAVKPSYKLHECFVDVE